MELQPEASNSKPAFSKPAIVSIPVEIPLSRSGTEIRNVNFRITQSMNYFNATPILDNVLSKLLHLPSVIGFEIIRSGIHLRDKTVYPLVERIVRELSATGQLLLSA